MARGRPGSRHTLHTVSRLLVNFFPPTLRLTMESVTAAMPARMLASRCACAEVVPQYASGFPIRLTQLRGVHESISKGGPWVDDSSNGY